MTGQGDLFGDQSGEVDRPPNSGSPARPFTGESGTRIPRPPLASRLRPTDFDQFAGQTAVVATLRRLAEAGRLPSLILWGPPGSGKTTLAGLLAHATGARFVTISAVGAGVADLRRLVAEAAAARRQGRPTVLFIDEIHRFNRAQQDAILPHVEDGTVTLIGATTENPSFEVVSALLSRCRVFRLEALEPAELDAVIARGLAALTVEIDPEARVELLTAAGGDARTALNILEAAAAIGAGRLGVEEVRQAIQRGHLLYDRAGDHHYDLVSALIKSVRGGDADAAVYWLARMLEAGEDLDFVARRLVISAAEDVGLADPGALQVAVAAQQAAHIAGMPEAVIPLAEAAVYLARARKSNSAYRAYQSAREAVRRTGSLPVPRHLRNASTGLTRELGHGHGYLNPHDHPDVPVEQQYLPDQLIGQRFYQPGQRDLPG